MKLTKERVVSAIDGVRYRLGDGTEGCIRMSSGEWLLILNILKNAVEGMHKKNWPKEDIDETTSEIKAIEEALAEVCVG